MKGTSRKERMTSVSSPFLVGALWLFNLPLSGTLNSVLKQAH